MQYRSDQSDKYILRFDEPGLRDRIKQLAAAEHRTLNGQLLHLIKLGMRTEQLPASQQGAQQ